MFKLIIIYLFSNISYNDKSDDYECCGIIAE